MSVFGTMPVAVAWSARRDEKRKIHRDSDGWAGSAVAARKATRKSRLKRGFEWSSHPHRQDSFHLGRW